MWSPDGQTVYYVSEVHGTPANIVAQAAAASPGSPEAAKPRQLTFHKDDGVRKARISANGAWIVYECGADLWVVGTQGGSPRKLAIEVHTDDKSNTERLETFTDRAREFALSADEKHVIFSVHGELFLQPVAPNAKATRLTQTTAYNHGVTWAPDGSKIIFISDRDGHDNLYLLEADDPEHPKFIEAHHFKTTKLTDTRAAESGVSFSPDGKRVTFLREGKLWGMNPNGSDLKVIVNETKVIDYEWSPDSKWIVYSRLDGSFASELYIIPAGGATAENPARNVTRYATWNAGVTWSANGKKIAFISERRGGPSLYAISLQKPAVPGAAPSSDIDWEDIHRRIEHPVPLSIREGAISPDGTKLAFAGGSNGEDLWMSSTSGDLLTRVTTGGLRPTAIQWSKKNPDLVYFRSGRGQLHMVRPGMAALEARLSPGTDGRAGRPSGSDSTVVPFSVKMTIKAEEEYAEMFEQSWRSLSENFYDSTFHGLDWDAVRAKYRQLVPHVTMKEDLYALLYLMMGELNASHLGVGGPLSTPEEQTADLGLLFDETYRGKGLKIAEVLKRGPADKRGLNLKAGEFIVAIDGAEVTEATDLSKLLNGKENESVVVQVTGNPAADPKDPKARRRVEIQATSRAKITQLMYDRWVANNAKRVEELSKGKLGYIHIPSMDEAGLDAFMRSLYSDNFDKEAIVLDVRFNGGGFTHDQVLNYLGGREHTLFRQRDGGEGLVLRPSDRKWTKPLVLLINNRSYSDAEIFPNAFRTLGLGKLVGQPTGGFVIGTGGVNLIDGSTFRIPRIGVYTSKGVNMEKEGVAPDVLVVPHPDQLAKGIDVQLDKAVEVLQADVLAWKKAHEPNIVVKPEEGKPVSPMPPAR
jgi:tricorn protease